MAGLGAKVLFQEEIHELSYSLVSAGASLSSSMPGDVGLMALQTVFLLSVVLPVLLLLALLLLWVLPLTPSEQDSLLYACYVMDAWSTLDVFVIAVIVAHAEFTRLAARLVATGSLAPVCNLAKSKFEASCMDFWCHPAISLISVWSPPTTTIHFVILSTLISLKVDPIFSFLEARGTQGGPGGPRGKPGAPLASKKSLEHVC